MESRQKFQRITLPAAAVNQNDDAAGEDKANGITDSSALISGYFIRKDCVYDHDSKRLYLSGDKNKNYLTFRQLQVLYWLLMGKTRTGIAEQLYISKRTVEYHCENIKQLLNEPNQARLIPMAINSGLAYVVVDIIENGAID